jgi:pyridoxine 5-phosphate synthase
MTAKDTASSRDAGAPGYLRLGVNVDHVATIRNARGGAHPDPVTAALIASRAGADGITAHLREDRRHIRDDDITRIREAIDKPLNFEMAATAEMLEIALRHRPNAACIVPEKREEITTEGGLDVAGQKDRLRDMVSALREAKIRVSLFIEADFRQLDAAAGLGADIVEIHTGRYCEETGSARQDELERIRKGVIHAHGLGLECHAGHGLGYETVGPVAAIPELVELNIGHFLIGEAVMNGLEHAVRAMRAHMDQARYQASSTT